MRTTITIDDPLLDTVRARARAEGKTVSAFIVDAVRAVLAESATAPAPVFRLVTFGGAGPAPGVDLDRTSELLAAEDETLYAKRG
jgi:hypothetical protein